MSGLIEQLRRGVDTNEPPDKTDRIMTKAADEIVKLQDLLKTACQVAETLEDNNAKLRAAIEALVKAVERDAKEGK